MKVSVVVGRFQVDELHEGHKALLLKACESCDYLLVFIGVSAIAGTKRNPLDYITREAMVLHTLEHQRPGERHTKLNIEPITDVEFDADWSKHLDSQIKSHIKYDDEVTLYGGQDSFLDWYEGDFQNNTHRLSLDVSGHATWIRKGIIQSPPGETAHFRRGVIYGIGNMRDTVSCTVDVACVKGKEVLVGKKAGERLWRFPGGFVDATDESIEYAGRRELLEETGLSIEGGLHYVGTHLSKDWRWRNSPDKAVMTTLFVSKYNFGCAKAGDDLKEVKWVPWTGAMDQMNGSHRDLYAMLYEWMTKRGSEL